MSAPKLGLREGLRELLARYERRAVPTVWRTDVTEDLRRLLHEHAE